jgi:hypothetical protein
MVLDLFWHPWRWRITRKSCCPLFSTISFSIWLLPLSIWPCSRAGRRSRRCLLPSEDERFICFCPNNRDALSHRAGFVRQRRVWSLVHPIQQGFEAIEPVAPEGAVEAHPRRPSRRSRTRPASFRTPRCLETAGCETPARSVRARTVYSPSRVSRSKIVRRVGSARALKRASGAVCQTHNSSVMNESSGSWRAESVAT